MQMLAERIRAGGLEGAHKEFLLPYEKVVDVFVEGFGWRRSRRLAQKDWGVGPIYPEEGSISSGMNGDNISRNSRHGDNRHGTAAGVAGELEIEACIGG
jgi:hypothetical protein